MAKTLQEEISEIADHPRWCRERLTIRDKRGIEVPLALTPGQLKFWGAVQKQLVAGKPVRVIVLKARQVHMSVGVASYVAKRVMFTPGQNGFVMAHLTMASSSLFRYYDQFQARAQETCRGHLQPLPLRARGTGDDAFLEFEQSSRIKFGSAQSRTTARAWSFRHVHLSEVAYYPDPGNTIGGLMQAVPDDAGTTVVIESTANGRGDWFWEQWQAAVNGDSAYEPVFVAWWEMPEYRLTAPKDFVPTREEMDMRVAYGLDNEQLAWRRWAISNKCMGSTDMFRQEFPSNPEEAFLTSGRPRFAPTLLSGHPIERTPIRGDIMRSAGGPGTVVSFAASDTGNLRLFRRPERSGQYAMGVDTTQGLDRGEQVGRVEPDYSFVCVLNLATGEQVASWYGRFQPPALAEVVWNLGEFYGWPYLVPEANGNGLGLIAELLRLGYPMEHIHRRRREVDDRRPPELVELGWLTTQATRPQLISQLEGLLQERSLVIRCSRTMDELHSFVIKSNGRAEAQPGSHDDGVFALALAVQGIIHAPRRSLRHGSNQPLSEPVRYYSGYRQ